MWKSRYKSIYKTDDPQLVITAVQSFPNIYDTLEKNIDYYNIKKLKEDLISKRKDLSKMSKSPNFTRD